MQISEIRTNNTYRNNMNGQVVTVTGMELATVTFTGCTVPMLKTLFAKNFSLFS